MKKQVFRLQYPWEEHWDKSGYKPEVVFELGMNEHGFTMHITVHETNPRREQLQHFSFVHEDSCVEWFVNFMPEKCDRYFNFEVNANGIMNVSFRKDRFEEQSMSLEDVLAMGIRATVYENQWEVDYSVPFTLIQKYIPEYRYTTGMTILSNFYKCGAKMPYKHHGIWNPMTLEKPDFHRPEFFKEIVLEW